ncbi:APC family permease [Streptomyces rugosispiralis]|uniref:APC family permease n=1 Tax=Streptomyces rugosispiralis TaxID=2967341 RepID=A0ABT1UQ50_9ACTN|nr:APC family permease [Streptomyces rugosispiralis]MCQ8187116.1 APC family permease [Streptomyces rugosispiralis]
MSDQVGSTAPGAERAQLIEGDPARSTATAPDDGRLRGRIGVLELTLTVLAFSAPMVVVTGPTPFVIIFGGAGAPLAFVLAMAVLLLFTVGYTAMTRYLPNPGAFYAYITAGLGKIVGLGSSFLALFAYLAFGVSTYAFFAVVGQDLVETVLHGPAIPWYVYGLGGIAATGVLGYFRVDLSAKVLSVVMACEVLLVGVFDGAVLWKGGADGPSLTPFTWHALTSGSVGLAVLFAVMCFVGFEATAVFREETRDPQRTVPRATYLSVVSIGVFYVVAAWCLILAYGTDRARAVAESNFAGMFSSAAATYLGTWASDAVTALVVTSAFAAILAGQNILARYCHSLSVDRVLPPGLSKVHPRHGSPCTSSLTITAVMAVALSISALSTSDITAAYSQLAGAAAFAVVVLMFLTNLSVVFFFKKNRDIADAPAWHRLIAPVLSGVGLGVVLWLSLANFTTMTGGSMGTAIALQVVIWAVFLTGMALAAVYRSRRPDVYARIGRQKAGGSGRPDDNGTTSSVKNPPSAVAFDGALGGRDV